VSLTASCQYTLAFAIPGRFVHDVQQDEKIFKKICLFQCIRSARNMCFLFFKKEIQSRLIYKLIYKYPLQFDIEEGVIKL
jgi:hypothetical protein